MWNSLVTKLAIFFWVICEAYLSCLITGKIYVNHEEIYNI